MGCDVLPAVNQGAQQGVGEAPIGTAARHQGVRDLLDNGWLHLFQISDDGHVAQRYSGNLTWQPVSGA